MAAARSCEGWAAVWMIRSGRNSSISAEQRVAIANIERFVTIAGDFSAQPLQHPTRVAFRPEKDRAMIAVDSGDAETLAGEEYGNLRTNQPARS